MNSSKSFLVILCFIIVAGVSFFAMISVGSIGSPSKRFPLQTPQSSGAYFFGNASPNFTGWRMPSKTLALTSFVTNRSITRFIGATLNVFPYQINQTGLLYLGLYVDGNLMVNQTYSLGYGQGSEAVIRAQSSLPSGDLIASFISSMEGYTISLLSIQSVMPKQATISITVFATVPLWVQIDQSSTINSYEMRTTTSPVPTSISSAAILGSPALDLTAPYALNIGVESI